jgi:hypothetical protein
MPLGVTSGSVVGSESGDCDVIDNGKTGDDTGGVGGGGVKTGGRTGVVALVGDTGGIALACTSVADDRNKWRSTIVVVVAGAQTQTGFVGSVTTSV